MGFETEFKEKLEWIHSALKSIFPAATSFEKTIYNAMQYSLDAGGKRIRPLLCLCSYEFFRSDTARALKVALALELIHTYSLIHDDLPAMDNDDLRRGKPTNHKVFGEDMAILAGDGLLTYAFELLSQAAIWDGISIEVIGLIANKAGPSGMVGGQAADIRSHEYSTYSRDFLSYVHNRKTADLIEASVLAGAIAGGAGEADKKNLSLFGRHLGLAFQIADDILDVTASSAQLGKTPGKDRQQNKLTYPAVYGLDRSRELAEELLFEALENLSGYGDNAQPLRKLAGFLTRRDK